MTPNLMIQADELCPKCGSGDGWHRCAKVDPAEWLIAQLGGSLARPIMSLSGGHCLSCNHEEEAVYADEGSQ